MIRRGQRVAVVGAGVAGIAAARALAAAGVEVVVLERADVVGGRVRTLHLAGTPVDVGAQFVAPFCDGVLGAARACGLAAELPLSRLDGALVDQRGVRPLSGSTVVFSDLMPLRDRLRLLTVLGPFLRHRRLLDPHDLSRARPLDDASAQQFVDDRAGRGASDSLIEPLVRALLYWDLSTTSRAVLLVMVDAALRARMVHRPTRGMDRLASELAASLDVRLGTDVTGLQRVGSGWRVLTDHDTLDTDAVVCATPADDAARLLTSAAPEVAAALRTVTYSRTSVVVCRVPAGLAPTSTQLFRTGWAPDLAAVSPVVGVGTPDGAGVASGTGRFVRIFLSDRGAAATAGMDDADVSVRALDAVRRAGSAWASAAEPVAVWRWARALPRFEVGALRRRPIPAWAPSASPGLALAGDFIGGPYLEGAWVSGETAARLLLTSP